MSANGHTQIYTSLTDATTDLLDPLLPLFRERAAAGYSQEDISSIFELIRTKDR